jgi:hypothetical protein
MTDATASSIIRSSINRCRYRITLRLWAGWKIFNDEGQRDLKVKWSRKREVITSRAGMQDLPDNILKSVLWHRNEEGAGFRASLLFPLVCDGGKSRIA